MAPKTSPRRHPAAGASRNRALLHLHPTQIRHGSARADRRPPKVSLHLHRKTSPREKLRFELVVKTSNETIDSIGHRKRTPQQSRRREPTFGPLKGDARPEERDHQEGQHKNKQGVQIMQTHTHYHAAMQCKYHLETTKIIHTRVAPPLRGKKYRTQTSYSTAPCAQT